MSNIIALREKRNKLMHDATAIVQQQEVTTEQRAQVDRMLAEADVLEADIKREERIAKFQSEQRATVVPPRGQVNGGEQDAERRSFSDFIRFGRIPEQRDLGVGPVAGSISGGAQFVPEAFYPILTQAQQAYGQILSQVNVKRTDSGAPMKIALANDTANGLTVVGETIQVTEVDPALSGKMSSTDKVTTGVIKVTLEELQDSAFNIDSFIRDSFGARYYRGASKMLVNGSTNVESIVTSATVGATTATGETTTLTFDDVMNLWGALDPAYQASASFAMNTATRLILMKVKDNQGRYIWEPSIAAGAPDTILGKQVIIAPQMDSVAAGKLPVLFGDFRAGYTYRVASDLQIIRMNEKFIDSGEIGFIGFARIGGFSTDAGTHPILSLKVAAS